MPFGAHRDNDSRACGAKTIVTNQSTVFVNDKLWAVKGDKNDHAGGSLINTTGNTILIENKEVIVHGPDKTTDNCILPLHLTPDENQTAQGSGDTLCY